MLRSRDEAVKVALVAAVAVILVWSIVSAVHHADSLSVTDLELLGGFALWMTLGSLLDVRLPGAGVVVAPASIAVALALAMVVTWPSLGPLEQVTSYRVGFGNGVILLTIAVGLLVGGVLSRLVGVVRVRWPVRCAILISAAVTAIVFDAVPHRGTYTWQSMLIMLACAAAPGLLWLLVLLLTARPNQAASVLAETVFVQVPVGAACISSAVAIAFGTSALGVLAAPLVAFPLVLMRFAIHQQERQRTTRRQTVAALARLTEVAGYNRAGHSRQVAQLCRLVGVRLGLGPRQLSVLEDAALLHDIGQVSLDRPIPDGATTEAAPLDQRAIAEAGAGIVRRTGRMESVATLLDDQATPYHMEVIEGAQIPIGSRIIKVCNAYVDHLAGDPGRHSLAMERLYLGLGYEYDPEVIDALMAELGGEVHRH
ncbi:HD domain-containing phosphohydrolase [Branchiibius sp. NY16-3462-2]|uniref:HD-GYP domain-containing protein n=1 Tax=Branchiibius sp. NY16-3462-2 TaxID=1807500 RepID=UPI0007997493|nr:HD domain-containing phosphohydrolase [Branchiibius sp. NY16-3462-2]KYH45887.1 hypothetical protein AZH51_09390 [Branchiibius sp. NY16-3462-2]